MKNLNGAKLQQRRPQANSDNQSTATDENTRFESDDDYEHNLNARRLRRTNPIARNLTATGNFVEVPASATSCVEGLSPMAIYQEERMRRQLQFFFMNPIEKWQARRQFPYKFVVQVIKIIVVTVQLCLFAYARYNHVNYTWDNRVAFSHLFLRGWDATRETDSYPPSLGPFAIYQKSDFFDTIDYAVHGYATVNRSIGPYDYPTANNRMPHMKLCLYSYREGEIFGFNESYVFNPAIDMLCESLPPNVTKTGVREYLAGRGVIINFASLVKASLHFAIKTINFKSYGGPQAAPDCYKFNINILFDNRDHDGQMLLSLDTEAKRLRCNGDVDFITDARFDALLRSLLNLVVVLVCLMSLALCVRALFRACLLRRKTIKFFEDHFGKQLSCEGRWQFVNFWYIMIVFNDVLLILGSIAKEEIQRKSLVVDRWDTCSLFLGIGNLLVWFGVLRYLGFFKTYNVVILTLKQAAPKILRFLLAALLIYAGFVFCGWLILGPYHLKFRSLSTTSECLFALINGDDMFATFATLSGKAGWLWYFSQIYLYSFIMLYIYVVLSLFISVIMDAYDTIKRYYRDGFPISDLREFTGTPSEADIISGVFMNNVDNLDDDDEENGFKRTMRSMCCCCCSSTTTEATNTVNNSEPTQYTGLARNGR